MLDGAMTLIADEIVAASERFASALEGAGDPTARAGRLEWSIQQLGAHLATGTEGYAAMVRGEPTHLAAVAERDAIGAAAVARERSTPVEQLAERVRHGSKSFAETIRASAPDDELRFYESSRPAATVGGLLLAELLVHGWDLARIPIPAEAAAFAARAALAVMPLALRPGTRPRRASFGFHVRGYFDVTVSVNGDDAVVTDGRAPVDVRVSGEAGPFLLAIYSREGTVRPLLRRRVSISGRKPWRISAMTTRFETA